MGWVVMEGNIERQGRDGIGWKEWGQLVQASGTSRAVVH